MAAGAGERGGRRPGWMSSRGRGAASVLLLALATGASCLGPWVHAAGVSPLGGIGVSVSGAVAAPAVPATALVLAAAGAAVALAGRLGRWLVVAVVAACGLVVVAAATAVLRHPETSASAAAAARTGVDHLDGAPVVTAGPWAAVVIGLLAVLAAGMIARASAGWSTSDRRHELHAGAAAEGTPGGSEPQPPDERTDWDALTRGADPSDDA